MTGTVKEFEWTNPRSWLRIIVEDQASGKPLQWVLKMDAPAQQARVGWKPDFAKPSEKVTIIIHPLKDGFAPWPVRHDHPSRRQLMGDGSRITNPAGE